MSKLNTLTIPGNPFNERLTVWAEMIVGYCKSMRPTNAKHVVVRATFYVKEPTSFLSEYTSELIGSLVEAGIIMHPSCVVELDTRQLPTGPNRDPERVVIHVEKHWTEFELAGQTRWSVE